MIETEGLTHIHLVVGDMSRSLAFYTRVFGMEELFREGDDLVFLRTPGAGDTITLNSEPDSERGRPGESGGIAHFGFRLKRAGDMDAAVQEIGAAGGALIRTWRALTWRTVRVCLRPRRLHNRARRVPQAGVAAQQAPSPSLLVGRYAIVVYWPAPWIVTRRARCSWPGAYRAPHRPRTSPTTIRSGRIRRAFRTRSRTVTAPAPSTNAGRASSPMTCGCARRSSAASSIVMSRSCGETKDDSTPRSVVLPELVPPEMTMFVRARTHSGRNSSIRGPSVCERSRSPGPIGVDENFRTFSTGPQS
jgi:catechol 2,3-dioxygenase-like lactoylglutathione lyase family enzyme